jgi:hypothetical protein
MIVIAVNFWDAPEFAGVPSALRGSADAIHRNTKTFERLNVNWANKARADDAGA